MSSPCETENLFFELQYLLHLLQCWGTDDGSLSWHTVLSMYEYSFTFNQEDQLLGWNLSTCKWFLPNWYTLSVHILIDTSYYHIFLGWFAKIWKIEWMIFGFGHTNQQIVHNQLFPVLLEWNQLSGSFIFTLLFSKVAYEVFVAEL